MRKFVTAAAVFVCTWTVTASAWNESNRASAYAAEVFGTSPRFASSTTGMSLGIDWSVSAWKSNS